MTTFELISLIVAMGALLASALAVLFSALQTRRATEAVTIEAQLSRSEAILHFSNCFLDLAREGRTRDLVADPAWAERFWALHTLEFYFFQHDILPLFIFSLWVTYLAQLYAGPSGAVAWTSHRAYLEEDVVNYAEMTQFYERVHAFAVHQADPRERNEQIADFVAAWLPQHRRRLLS
jgi:hypothetical protein